MARQIKKRATPAQMEERVAKVAELLASGLYMWQVKEQAKKLYGLSGSHVQQTLIPRAQKLLRGRLTRDETELRADSMAFYEHVIRDPDASVQSKLRARKQLDKLLGLPKPVRVDITTDGKSIKGYVGIDVEGV